MKFLLLILIFLSVNHLLSAQDTVFVSMMIKERGKIVTEKQLFKYAISKEGKVIEETYSDNKGDKYSSEFFFYDEHDNLKKKKFINYKLNQTDVLYYTNFYNNSSLIKVERSDSIVTLTNEYNNYGLLITTTTETHNPFYYMSIDKEIINDFFQWHDGIPYGKVTTYYFYNEDNKISHKEIYRNLDTISVLVGIQTVSTSNNSTIISENNYELKTEYIYNIANGLTRELSMYHEGSKHREIKNYYKKDKLIKSRTTLMEDGKGVKTIYYYYQYN